MSWPLGIQELGVSTNVAATGSNVQGVIVMPSGANGLHIVNTSVTVFVSVAWGTTAQTAALGTHPSIPPMGDILVETNDHIGHVAAIGSAAGPTAVIFTPVKIAAP